MTNINNRIEVGRIDYMTSSVIYYTDGEKTINHGHGWYDCGRVARDVDIVDVYVARVAEQVRENIKYPAQKALRNRLIYHFGVFRGKIVDLLAHSNDPSEFGKKVRWEVGSVLEDDDVEALFALHKAYCDEVDTMWRVDKVN